MGGLGGGRGREWEGGGLCCSGGGGAVLSPSVQRRRRRRHAARKLLQPDAPRAHLLCERLHAPRAPHTRCMMCGGGEAAGDTGPSLAQTRPRRHSRATQTARQQHNSPGRQGRPSVVLMSSQ